MRSSRRSRKIGCSELCVILGSLAFSACATTEALLEKGAGNQFSARVFPIAPHAQKHLVISFSQELPGERYTLPLRGLPMIKQVDVRLETTDAKGVKIREFECPLRFVCQCRVGLRIVEGVGYVQLERRGLHNINSHVDETNYDAPPELEEGTDDEHEDFDTENEEASGADDDHPGDADESVSADVGL